MAESKADKEFREKYVQTILEISLSDPALIMHLQGLIMTRGYATVDNLLEMAAADLRKQGYSLN